MKKPVIYYLSGGIVLLAIAAYLVVPLAIERHQINQLRNQIQRGDAKRVSMYIEQDAHLLDVDLGERHGDNLKALSLAAGLGKADICSNLISFGADVNARDKYGYTPLHYAAMGGQTDVVELLIQRRADPSLKDFEGFTPLELAKKFEVSSNIIRALTTAQSEIKLK